MLPVMVTFTDPDTRTAPPPSPAVESTKSEFWIRTLLVTLLSTVENV